MQLQMAQQNAQDGQANMTVAQQREQEVDALTKNELAQQRGETAQKQAGDQQAMLQKMMGGVASAPGAAMAAQPKAMAAGGIVGYAGPEGSVVVGDTMGTPSVEAQELASQASEMATDERSRAKLIAELEEKLAFLTRAAPQLAPAVRAQLEAIKTSGATSLPKAPPVAVPPAAKLPPAAAAMPKPPGLPSLPGAAGPAMPKPPGAAMPRPPAMPGAAGPAAPAGPAPLPPVQPGVAGPANDFGKKLEAAALKNAEIDPSVRQLTEEKRAEERLALTPEQRKVYEEGIGGLQKMYQEQYDPERQRREGITRALIGAGGRRYGEFPGAASAGMAYNDQQRAAKLKEFGDVQKARTGLVALDRANVKDAIGAGQKAYEQSASSQRQGLASGSSLYGDDVKSRDTRYNIDVTSRDNLWKMNEESRNKVLDRNIDKLKIDAQNAATSATREGLSQDRARTVYSATVARVQELERKLDNDFKTGPMGLLLQQDPTKLKPEDKNRLDIANLELERQKTRLRREMEPVLADARRKLGVADIKLSPEDQAAIDKYAKGK